MKAPVFPLFVVTHSGEPCSCFFLEILVFWTLQFASPLLNLVAYFGLWSGLWFQALPALVMLCVMNHWNHCAPLATPAFRSISFWHWPWHQAMSLVVVDLIAKPKYFSSFFLALCLYQIMTTEMRPQRWGGSGPRFDQISLSAPESESQLYMWTWCTVLVVLAFFGHLNVIIYIYLTLN